MRKIQRKAAGKQTSRLSFNTQSGLPAGLGALSFRSGSYWMVFRSAEGVRVQENTHTKNRIVARVMLAERVLERITAEQKLLGDVIREGANTLSENGWHRLSDGGWIGDPTFTERICATCGQPAGDDWRTAGDRHQEVICARCAGRPKHKARRGKASDRTRAEVGR